MTRTMREVLLESYPFTDRRPALIRSPPLNDVAEYMPAALRRHPRARGEGIPGSVPTYAPMIIQRDVPDRHRATYPIPGLSAERE
jgi:hypothetical protein